MGFLDKAKKLAEQAQTKLDEVQKQVNTSGGGTSSSSGAPITEYDKHGRPIPREQSATPPHGDPLTAAATAPHSSPPPSPGVTPTEPPSGPPTPIEGVTSPPPSPGVPATPSSPPVESVTKAPAMPGAPGSEDEDRNRPSYAPPKLTGGDPLAG